MNRAILSDNQMEENVNKTRVEEGVKK